MKVPIHEIPTPPERYSHIINTARINVIDNTRLNRDSDNRFTTQIHVPGADVTLYSNQTKPPSAFRTSSGDLIVAEVSEIDVKRSQPGIDGFRGKRDVTIVVFGEVDTATVSDVLDHKVGPGLAQPRGITLEVDTVQNGHARAGGTLVINKAADTIYSVGEGSFVWAQEVKSKAHILDKTGADGYINNPSVTQNT